MKQLTAAERFRKMIVENEYLLSDPRVRANLDSVHYIPTTKNNRFPDDQLFDFEPINTDLGLNLAYCWRLGTCKGIFIQP